MLRSGLSSLSSISTLRVCNYFLHPKAAGVKARDFAATTATAAAGEEAAGGDGPHKAQTDQRLPTILPFSSPPTDALAAFKQYQREALFKLHAGDLLKADYRLEPAFLPFYLFEATISAEAIAVLGRRMDKSRKNSPLVWHKMSEWKQTADHVKLSKSEWYMQVYASYRFRRDLAEAAKPWPNTLATHSKPLTQQDLDKRCYRDPVASSVHSQGPAKQQPPAHGSSSSSDSSSRSSSNSSSNHSSSRSSSSNANHSQTAAAAGGVSGYSTSSHSSSTSSSSSSKGRQRSLGVGEIALDSADMRQAIAWQLCHRQILHQQIAAAADYLKQTMSADDVRDIRLHLKVHDRTAHLAYFPAYHLWYVQGEKYTGADIVPAEYDALVGGGPQARVAAELHASPMKSRAVAAAAVSGVCLGGVPLTSYALGIDPSLASVAGADALFLGFLAAITAGLIAAKLPLMARNRHAAEQVAADRKFYKQFDQRETAHGAPPDEHTLWLWKDSDWRKWEQEDRWHWDGPARKLWAESLFRQHAQREIDRVAAARQREQQSQQREEEEKRESQRDQKFGRKRQFTSQHHDESGAGARMDHQQPARTRRRRDFLGYYKALGINLEESSLIVSSNVIKSHYKQSAMKLHPDRHVHSDEPTRKRAAERFRRLQLAYETLKDNEKRRAYDQGRLTH